MRRESKEPGFTGFARGQKCLHGAVRTEDGLHLFEGRYRVQLVQVEMIRAQAFE